MEEVPESGRNLLPCFPERQIVNVTEFIIQPYQFHE